MGKAQYSQKYPSLSATYVFIFIIGLACMSVAGYFLIEGLSQFSGGHTAKRMLIVGGILFQITESVCFISASALTYHSLRWRYILFALGIVLFSFSIAVMTLAQKTALQTGEAQAQAIDEKREYIRQQISSLDEVIGSYRFNAEKQSKSIYKDSRALGQDSLNRATELEEKKLTLSEELFRLNESRRQTSSDFFQRLEEVLGLPATSTEFYFLVIRSLLLELCGIILMSFGANLRAYKQLVTNAQAKNYIGDAKTSTNSATNVATAELTNVKNADQQADLFNTSAAPATVNTTPNKIAPAPSVAPTATLLVRKEEKADKSSPEDQPAPSASDPLEIPDTPNTLASPKIRKLHLKEKANTTDSQLEYFSTMVMDLYEQKLITDLNDDSIRQGLYEHCRQNINMEMAKILSRILLSRQEELC